MRVALVHDWLTGLRGGERCLLAFLKLYPNADIFTLLHVPGATSPIIDARVCRTSVLQLLPGAAKYYRFLLPLFPFAVRRFDFTGYDLVISLSHAAAKNIVVPPGTVHVCYCFTPMRYIWDQVQTYFGAKTPLLWPIISILRRWDRAGSKSVDHFAAISRFVAARIRLFYRRRASVIFPPVDTSWITAAAVRAPGEAFLYAGALVPYKRVDLVVQVCSALSLPLHVVGDGPEEARLRAMAGPTVKFFGRVPDPEFAKFFARARALIFTAKEDFGMIPIEALAVGCPVVGLYEGALRETLTACKPWQPGGVPPREATGVFFRNSAQSSLEQGLSDALRFFMTHEAAFKPINCRRQAEQFSVARFEADWCRCMAETLHRPDLLPESQAEIVMSPSEENAQELHA